MSTWGRRGCIVVGFTTTCCMWQFKYQVISNDNFFFTYQVEQISNYHLVPCDSHIFGPRSARYANILK